MTIRRMAETDYDPVFTLWQNTAGMGLNPADDSREGIIRYLRRNPTTCFVAEEGGALIGAILSGHDGRRAYVYHMAVAEAHRRRGIGEAQQLPRRIVLQQRIDERRAELVAGAGRVHRADRNRTDPEGLNAMPDQ